MTQLEVNTFISEMNQCGDTNWTYDAVMEVYGDRSLDYARKDRMAALDRFSSIIDNVLNHNA